MLNDIIRKVTGRFVLSQLIPLKKSRFVACQLLYITGSDKAFIVYKNFGRVVDFRDIYFCGLALWK